MVAAPQPGGINCDAVYFKIRPTTALVAPVAWTPASEDGTAIVWKGWVPNDNATYTISATDANNTNITFTLVLGNLPTVVLTPDPEGCGMLNGTVCIDTQDASNMYRTEPTYIGGTGFCSNNTVCP